MNFLRIDVKSRLRVSQLIFVILDINEQICLLIMEINIFNNARHHRTGRNLLLTKETSHQNRKYNPIIFLEFK